MASEKVPRRTLGLKRGVNSLEAIRSYRTSLNTIKILRFPCVLLNKNSPPSYDISVSRPLEES